MDGISSSARIQPAAVPDAIKILLNANESCQCERYQLSFSGYGEEDEIDEEMLRIF